MLFGYFVAAALAADLMLVWWLSVPAQPDLRRKALALGAGLAFIPAALDAAWVGGVMVLPLYGLWAAGVRATASHRAASPWLPVVMTAGLGTATLGFLSLYEPSFAHARPEPSDWFLTTMASLRDLLPGDAALAFEQAALALYGHLPSVVLGGLPALTLALSVRFAPTGRHPGVAAWMTRPLNLAFVVLLGVGLLIDPSPDAEAEAGLLGLLERHVVAEGELVAGVHFALLAPLAWSAATPWAWVGALGAVATLGSDALPLLAAAGVATALFGWRSTGWRSTGWREAEWRSRDEPSTADRSIDRWFALPRPPDRVALALTALLLPTLVGFTLAGFGPDLPRLHPGLPESTLTPTSEPCTTPDGFLAFDGYAIECSEAGPAPRGALEPSATPTPADAEALCHRRGLRVCTDAEWTAACRAPDGRWWPFGDHFDFAVMDCPDRLMADTDWDALPAMCRSALGAWGFAGSRWEWVRDGQGGHRLKGDRRVRGLGASCSPFLQPLDADRWHAELDLGAVGTRCCRSLPRR